MGLISGLVLLPVTAPVQGFRFVLEQLRDQADAVLNDEGRSFAELAELGLRRRAGELTDAEYAEQEAALLGRLTAIRAAREEDDAWLEPELDEDEPVVADHAVEHAGGDDD